MNTVLQRLLKYPHSAVFDVDPGESLALRVRHPDGARWSIADEVLTVAAGAVSRTYQLADKTVSQLAAALVADGFEVPQLSSEWSERSALVLAEGSGDQGASNGDHISAFTSILWALLSGYSGELRMAAHQIVQALRQMVLHQAEMEWLDLWGTLYGVPRKDGEMDAAYAPRIVREVLRLRVNAHGIEQAILDETGADVRIEEPWKDLFILDHSTLSGPHRLYDGVQYGYHLIRPVAREPADPLLVLPVIHRNRPAGVSVLEMRGVYVSRVFAPEPQIASKITHLVQGEAVYEDRALLDFMAIEDTSVRNYEPIHLRILVRRDQVIVDPASYSATAKHTSTYRIFRGVASYDSRYWSDESWIRVGGDWDDSTIAHAGHVRLS